MADKSETIKKKLTLDVEVDATQLAENPYIKFIQLAHAFDRWRVFPRAFITVYIYLLYEVVMWFMALPDPNSQQASLVSVVVGAGAAWFGIYAGTMGKYSNKSSKTVKDDIHDDEH